MGQSRAAEVTLVAGIADGVDEDQARLQVLNCVLNELHARSDVATIGEGPDQFQPVIAIARYHKIRRFELIEQPTGDGVLLGHAIMRHVAGMDHDVGRGIHSIDELDAGRKLVRASGMLARDMSVGYLNDLHGRSPVRRWASMAAYGPTCARVRDDARERRVKSLHRDPASRQRCVGAPFVVLSDSSPTGTEACQCGEPIIASIVQEVSDHMAVDRPSLDELTRRLLEFRDARDWRQFHSLKDLIVSLNLEASELLELTQWKSEASFESDAGTEDVRRRLAEECADVLLYLLLVAERAGIDIQAAAAQKIAANEVKYPVSKARGTAAKYTRL